MRTRKEKKEMILYKYRSWDKSNDLMNFQRRILTDNELYLSGVDQFNDPFDCALPFKYKESELTRENLYLKLYGIGKILWPNLTESQIKEKCIQRIDSGAFENGRYWKENKDEFLSSVKTTMGVFSLSATNNNLLMWSHYADSHKGFCIGLDYNMLFEVSGSLGPVIYNDAFPEMSLNLSNRDFLILFITKSKAWAYEEEYRIVKTDHARKVLKIPDECIKEIVLGYKMEQNHKEEIIKIAREKSKSIEILEADLDSEVFRINISKINN